MNQKEITLLMSYVLNNRTRLESELDRRQSNIRMREFTLTDCVECAYSSVYLEVFNQVTTDILHRRQKNRGVNPPCSCGHCSVGSS